MNVDEAIAQFVRELVADLGVEAVRDSMQAVYDRMIVAAPKASLDVWLMELVEDLDDRGILEDDPE